MRISLLLLLTVCLSLVSACGGEVSGEDDGGLSMDASAFDAGADTDAGATDAGDDTDASTSDAGDTDAGPLSDGGTPDGGTGDAGATDAGAADAGATDAGLADGGVADGGCSGACAAPAPLCGTSCSEACGCCACEGPGFCSDGAAWNCAGDCIARTPCGDSDCSVSSSGVANCGSCASLEARYLDLVNGSDSMRCENPESCQVLFGHCGVGLGGCHYGVNLGVTQAQLDAIAAQWTARGCEAGRPVCRCAAPPSVRCDSGGCLLNGFGSGS